MKQQKDWLPLIIKYIIIGVMMIYILVMIIGLSSCNFLKDVQKTSTDSSGTTKQDSGRVTSNTATNTSSEEWWRETLKMYAGKRDTNITNIILPDEQPAQPPYITVIREGGKSNSQTAIINYDSIWKARQDSINLQKDEKAKQSESSFFGPTVILAICGGMAILVIIVLIWVQYNISKNSKAFSTVIEKITNK